MNRLEEKKMTLINIFWNTQVNRLPANWRIIIRFTIFFLFIISQDILMSQPLNSSKNIVENGLLKAITIDDQLLDKYNIYERMDFYNVPAVSITVIDSGKISWSKSYGNREAGIESPLNKNTLFQIGSTGKMIAALTTLSLVQKGLLDLNKDINDYLTSWKISTEEQFKGSPVTLKMLLSHTAGIQQDYSSPFKHDEYVPTLTEHINNNNYRIIKPPGEGYFYSEGLAYIIIEQIIENVLGKPYEVVAREEVLIPLKMVDLFSNILRR